MNPFTAFKSLSLLTKLGIGAGAILAAYVAYSVWIGGVKSTAKKEGAQGVIIEIQEKGLEDAKQVNKAENDFRRNGPSRADCLRDARNPENCPGE